MKIKHSDLLLNYKFFVRFNVEIFSLVIYTKILLYN